MLPLRLNRLKRAQFEGNGPIYLYFPEGLHGFKKHQHFILQAHKSEIPFMWIESLKGYNESFVVIDPFLVKEDYDIPIMEDFIQSLNIVKETPLVALCIVNVREDPFTVNLAAPLLIH